MSNDWIDEQKKILAEHEEQLEVLKSRLSPDANPAACWNEFPAKGTARQKLDVAAKVLSWFALISTILFVAIAFVRGLNPQLLAFPLAAVAVAQTDVRADQKLTVSSWEDADWWSWSLEYGRLSGRFASRIAIHDDLSVRGTLKEKNCDANFSTCVDQSHIHGCRHCSRSRRLPNPTARKCLRTRNLALAYFPTMARRSWLTVKSWPMIRQPQPGDF